MTPPHTATAEVTIHATAEKVWEALTDPKLVKEYFFGVDLITDWEVGSPIVYKGEWQGIPFEDKGTVLAVKPNEQLMTNYWSSFSGLADAPENYQTVTYQLESSDDTTKVTVTQENILTEKAAEDSEKNWNNVLAGLKKLLEEA